MVASEDEAKSVKDEPSTEGEKEKEPAERKTSRLRMARTAPDSSFGRLRGDEARDQLIAELEDAVDIAEANAFEAKVAAKRAATRAEVRETVASLDERMSTLEAAIGESKVPMAQVNMQRARMDQLESFLSKY